MASQSMSSDDNWYLGVTDFFLSAPPTFDRILFFSLLFNLSIIFFQNKLLEVPNH